ncbi:MAG TPA: 4'-phosphopantetheinyl transferase superfamily protein [Casimicrobiaceae bacterium]|nr:4'-phosphopantetheinyl transferase superfamily protein [Casimicrobiaceae bacterium]
MGRASVDDFPGTGNAPTALESPAEGVAVWWATLDALDDDFARLASWLAPAEHARAARFGREALRRRYVVGRATLRWVLGRALGVAPGAVPIVRGERGRPKLDGTAELDFNISHTEGIALIGLARSGRIGVDVERARRDVEADGLARKFLTSSERATLEQLDGAARRARFLRYWTCKEAMSKATGDGLSAPFRHLDVRLDDAIELLVGPAPYERAQWRLCAVKVPAEFIGTVALWRTDSIPERHAT